jgi:hypothetical protein
MKIGREEKLGKEKEERTGGTVRWKRKVGKGYKGRPMGEFCWND